MLDRCAAGGWRLDRFAAGGWILDRFAAGGWTAVLACAGRGVVPDGPDQ